MRVYENTLKTAAAKLSQNARPFIYLYTHLFLPNVVSVIEVKTKNIFFNDMYDITAIYVYWGIC